MKCFKIIMLSLTLCVGFILSAQNDNDSTIYDYKALSKLRNQQIKNLLDYRYKGGSGAFERDFFKIVEYNDNVRQECVIGTVIISFSVYCDGTMGEFLIINPVNEYINMQLQKFYIATTENWNLCQDDRYSRFEIPILFTVEGADTDAQGFIVFEAESSGYPCKSDSYYTKEYETYKGKKNKKALKALEVLIKRNPYNQDYVEEMKMLREK